MMEATIGELEVVEWDADDATVELDSGAVADVTRGDKLLVMHNDSGMVFVEMVRGRA